jgi:hypothetical protein
MSTSSTSTTRGSSLARSRPARLKTPSPKRSVKAVVDRESSSEVSGSQPYSDDDEQSNNDNDNMHAQSSSDPTSEDDEAAAYKSQHKKRRVYEYSLGTSHKQQQAVERIDDGADQIIIQPPVHRDPPLAVWNTIDESMKQVKVEKTAVHDFVANYLFPKLKFVRGTAGVNMEYSTDARSLCALVMAGCHQEHSAEGMIWWASARKQTIQEIKRLRNDASKNLKTTFLGKTIE